jgi:spermidine synthase
MPDKTSPPSPALRNPALPQALHAPGSGKLCASPGANNGRQEEQASEHANATAAPAVAASTPVEELPALVKTRGDRRSLEFRPGMIQSEMRLSRPDELVLRYSRAMMCFTLFQPAPRHILMVGLGGGSLAKFCYRYLPDTRITVLELRADVIALREQFAIPPDDSRFTIVHADAAEYIARLDAAVDVLLLDGFDESGMPPVLGTPGFYAHCRQALQADGVLVVNLFSYDKHYRTRLASLRHIFTGQVCWFNAIAGNNRILFAVKGDARAQARTRHRNNFLTELAALAEQGSCPSAHREPAGGVGTLRPLAHAARRTPSQAMRIHGLITLWRSLGLAFLNPLLARFVVHRLRRRALRRG